MDSIIIDKLGAVQKTLRFSNSIREWCEKEHSVYFDDFDSENVDIYESGGYGELADAIIEEGLAESILDEEDLQT